jgi:hypothetical protein
MLADYRSGHRYGQPDAGAGERGYWVQYSPAVLGNGR